MSFESKMYEGFVAADSMAQQRLIRQYEGTETKFDIVIVGSGVGGGVLADALADKGLRILVLEAGSFLYPTHVYNLCRFLNHEVAKKFRCRTFKQPGEPKDAQDELFIGEQPQLNLGGRSIFWSGLIPTVQEWELNFFPKKVRDALLGRPEDSKSGLLYKAGEKMNQSVSMGRVAERVVDRLRNSWLAADFLIRQTPRALHQPYLQADATLEEATLEEDFINESTGVFNTAELLINQLGLHPGTSKDLHLLLNHFVEDVQSHNGHLDLIVRNTLTNEAKTFEAGKVVLAGGSIESPKLLLRSSLYPSLPRSVRELVGRGLTDHPTTDVSVAHVDGIGGIDLLPQNHFKIIFYSRGLRDARNEIRYPFNVEMNFNHEYWHLRKNDPADRTDADRFGNPSKGKSVLDIKFSFGNCLDDENEVKAAPPSEYVSEIIFHNIKRVERLATSRFPALAGWNKQPPEIWNVLNQITHQIFSLFRIDGKPAKPITSAYGQMGFGYGTVHHAVGSLRMPWYERLDQLDKDPHTGVVDEDLRVNGTKNLYVCDMSVIPISTTANPVRTLVALALRLSEHLKNEVNG